MSCPPPRTHLRGDVANNRGTSYCTTSYISTEKKKNTIHTYKQSKTKKGHSYRRAFPHNNFDFFSLNYFNLPYFPFFQIYIYVKFNELVFFCFWKILRIVTERLRILIHIPIFFQTLEFLGKTLSDKNEPKTQEKPKDKLKLVENTGANLYGQPTSFVASLDIIPGTWYVANLCARKVSPAAAVPIAPSDS